MIFNRFFINTSLRILLILATGFACIYFINFEEKLQTITVLAALTLLQIILLINYIGKTNRELASFIISLKEEDHSKAFSEEKLEKTFKGLHLSFNEISELLSKYKKEGHIKSAYIAAITEQLPIAAVAVKNNGKIDFSNRSFKRLLGKNELHSIEEIEIDAIKEALKKIEPGEKQILETSIHEVSHQLSFHATLFKSNEEEIKIISIQDIKSELQQKEMEAQQKLIRILNHEVMNSLAPISTLTSTIQRILQKDTSLENEKKADILESASLIEKRSEGLAAFIHNYKELTNLPAPQKKHIQLPDFLTAMEKLIKSELEGKNIRLLIEQEKNATIFADRNMLEQVFLNILKNAAESINHQNGKIEITAKKTADGKISIRISNNGSAIPTEDREKVFLPFFSTKQNGSGIGLSLSKQIIHLHGGELILQNKMEPTVFEIRF